MNDTAPKPNITSVFSVGSMVWLAEINPVLKDHCSFDGRNISAEFFLSPFMSSKHATPSAVLVMTSPRKAASSASLNTCYATVCVFVSVDRDIFGKKITVMVRRKKTI